MMRDDEIALVMLHWLSIDPYTDSILHTTVMTGVCVLRAATGSPTLVFPMRGSHSRVCRINL